jgi:hypothetical protein
MISASYKGEGWITSAVCAADLHVKLDQMPFNVKELSACDLMVKNASGPFSQAEELLAH